MQKTERRVAVRLRKYAYTQALGLPGLYVPNWRVFTRWAADGRHAIAQSHYQQWRSAPAETILPNLPYRAGLWFSLCIEHQNFEGQVTLAKIESPRR